MTRIQQFISAYLAGLCLIVVPLMLMSIFYAITALNEYIITFILGMFFLAVIYFTLSVLGCVLGGTFATQMMMMATISFGPLMLYAMIELCVNLLALGNMDGGLNFNLVMLICPLISASDFIMTAHWDYWFIHLLGTFMIFGLCLYLVKKRPFELSGEANVFYHAQVFLMRPLLYLNFVYLIFYFCSLNFFMTGRFDTKYYFQIIALLVGIGFLVEFIFDIWFSEGLHTLLTIKNVQRSLMMLLLACSLFLIPLWQRERSRTHYSNQAVSVTLHLSSDYDFYVVVGQEENDVTLKDVNEFLEYVDDHRNKFVRNSVIDGEETYMLWLNFYDEDGDTDTTQYYYIMPEEVDDDLSHFMSKIMKADREEWEISFMMNQTGDYHEGEDGNLYLKEDLIANIQKSYQESFSKDDFQNFSTPWLEDDVKSYSEVSDLKSIYVLSFANEDFESWLDQIYSMSSPVLLASEMRELDSLAMNFDDGYRTQNKYIIASSEQETFDSLEAITFDDIYDWKFLEVDENKVSAIICLDAMTKAEFELSNDNLLFDQQAVRLEYNVDFQKIDGQWTMQLVSLEEVIY